MDTMNTLRRQEKTIGNEIWQHCRACGVGSGRSCSLFFNKFKLRSIKNNDTLQTHKNKKSA